MPNKMIYLTEQNFNTIAHEDNASGLVNRLLTNYFAGHTVITKPAPITIDEEKKKRFEELKRLHPPLEIRTDFSEGQTVVPPEFAA